MEITQKELDDICATLKFPPIVPPSKNQDIIIKYGRKRIGDLVDVVAPKISKVLNINDDLKHFEDTYRKINDFDDLLHKIKDKIANFLSFYL